MLKAEWEGRLAEKEIYQSGKWHDLSEFRHIRPEVLASWERLRKDNLRENMLPIHRQMSKELLNDFLKQNSFLITLTSTILQTFQHYISADYALYLCDKDGVILLHAGDLIERVTNYSDIDGFIMDEHSIGTTSHSLCLEYQKPVQILGPEHYSADFRELVGSSAPIFDQNDQLIGALVLNQLMPENPWHKKAQDFFSYTLGFITVMSHEI
ncbi:MAG TPA: sigma-54-dependent Fis family transcriptional regulator, partial [Syntrophomonas sp.]|nr:sigma-54-dependent Fis family transcriptional regulator [Syntrophomonas sp.]